MPWYVDPLCEVGERLKSLFLDKMFEMSLFKNWQTSTYKMIGGTKPELSFEVSIFLKAFAYKNSNSLEDIIFF